jgi:hypothetical protein
VQANRSTLLDRGCSSDGIGEVCDACGLALRGSLLRGAGQRSER